MNRTKKNTSKGNFKYLRPLLAAEFRSFIKPYLLSVIFWILSLSVSLVLIFVNGELPTALYALLYASIITAALTAMITPAVRTISDIRRAPLYKKNALLPPNAIPTEKEFTAARFVTVIVFSFVTALLYATSELSVTLLGGYYYDGYFKGFVANIVLFFTVICYFTFVFIVSAADFLPNAKHPVRKCVLGGVLIYTLGLIILVTVILSVSGLSFGSDTTSDTSPGGIAPGTLLILSAIYFITSALRSVYLYFMAKKRLGRKLKLMKK